ncbi:hypothetical protein [Bdellovibrio sp. HCB274]|uniref:hypothetical protein n=1 Tax=Bdellovibrio sp. HCB274 TaxID=3394361 RepID=UPI0039B505F5
MDNICEARKEFDKFPVSDFLSNEIVKFTHTAFIFEFFVALAVRIHRHRGSGEVT